MIVRYGLNLGIDLSTASLDNWIHLFTDSGSYFRWFFNSTILTVLQVVLTLFISAFVAYGFAMYEFRFKTPLFITVLLLMSVPFEMMMRSTSDRVLPEGINFLITGSEVVRIP